MSKRENEFVESYKSLIANRNRLAELHESKKLEKVAEKQEFMNNYYRLREGIKEIDKNAFFIVTDSYEVFGGE